MFHATAKFFGVILQSSDHVLHPSQLYNQIPQTMLRKVQNNLLTRDIRLVKVLNRLNDPQNMKTCFGAQICTTYRTLI